MKGAASALILIFPTIVSAADGSGQEFSFLASLLQMIAALALVVGLILITWHFSGKLMKRLPVGQQLLSKHIRLIETRYLGPKKALLLVEVGGEYLLLSSSDTALTFIKQINMLEDIEVIEESPEQGSFATLLARLRLRHD
ncbi:MAG: flagellar biosynthetic protein FliO [Desulfuromonadaceae bacterium]|nr:flagellar biosynthetic protein FliO [Desulfuromonadaceae bacterium]MDD2847115.1 flagellar biosynthetic protein FliO [Desulfuromonadaceae bacterium]MDD4130059.1 flagellar biosynthetic protein FliO [Desulfuromonadaceae bacterium]